MRCQKWANRAGTLGLGLGLAALILSPAFGTYGDAPRESVMICDATGRVCLQPTAQGGLPGLSGGGGAGGGALSPQGVTMTVTNAPITGGAAITPTQTNSARKYYTAVNSTPGACRYGYGTAQTPATPSATSGMPLQASQAFTLEASAITYQSVSFWCAQSGTIDITEGQ